MTKWVYSFGAGQTEGRADMRDLLGGKGANLAEMANIGLPVPPGFTISTEVCTAFYDNDRKFPDDLKAQVRDALAKVEQAVELSFGDQRKPLLVSVRSGARVSMPGMMDTVLNLGLNDLTVAGLAEVSNDARFAWTAIAASSRCTARVVLGVEHHRFEEIIEQAKLEAGVIEDTGSDRARTGSAWSTATRRWCGRRPESRSRRTAGTALGRHRRGVREWRTPAPSPIAGCTRSPPSGAPRSTCRPWCSATWATIARPACASPAIPRPGKTCSTANIW